MLIVSKWHDYYDRITAFGIDKSIVYARNQEEIQIPCKEVTYLPSNDEFQVKKLKFECMFRVIGFCGKIYPVITVKVTADPGLEKFFSLYSVKDVEEFLQKMNISQRKDKDNYRYWRNCYLRTPSTLVPFFHVDTYKFLYKCFSDYKTPAFVWYDSSGYRDKKHLKVMLNPKLSTFDFYRVKDPVTAFQDVMMYISGVLGVPERPMVKLSDKELAKKRGHGDKYSFRKMPKKSR